VVDSAKAVAAADGLRAAAIPMTLAGSPFTPFHRLPAGASAPGLVRPALAVCDPGLMASPPLPGLAATAMNALAHACEALYAPLANPASSAVGLRAAELIAAALAPPEPDRVDLALGALLGGWAIGNSGLWVHHAVCQTIVRVAGTPHAETNAVMLPHSLRLAARLAPAPLARLARALGDDEGRPERAAELVSPLAGRAGVTRLGELGVEAGAAPEIARAASEHPIFPAFPGGPGEQELRDLVLAAI
jgi:maleylacetate reductase